MKTIFTFILALLLGVAIQAQKLNIAAAANLKYALEEIKTAYLKAHPKTNLNISFGSSGALSQQILNGAAFDLFMSADTDFPQKLKDKGATIGKAVVYASGKLVLYSTTLDVSRGLTILNDAAVKKIAIAKPEVAPYGARAVELMKQQGVFDNLSAKIVYADNISQAAQFAFTGNAEVGFIGLSLALSPEMASKGTYYIIDPTLCPPIDQACVRIKTPVMNPEAAKFMAFILSPEIKAIWVKYGYSTPKE